MWADASLRHGSRHGGKGAEPHRVHTSMRVETPAGICIWTLPVLAPPTVLSTSKLKVVRSPPSGVTTATSGTMLLKFFTCTLTVRVVGWNLGKEDHGGGLAGARSGLACPDLDAADAADGDDHVDGGFGGVANSHV